MRGDPLIETCDDQTVLLMGTKKYTLVKYFNVNDTACFFNIEIKTGRAGGSNAQRGLTVPRYLDVEMMGIRLHVGQHGLIQVSVHWISILI